jgi:hypothetical protein
MTTETTDLDTRNSSKTPEACRRETEEHKLKTAVQHGGAQIEQARPLETTVENQQAEAAQLDRAKEHQHTGQTRLQPKRLRSRKEMHA